MICKTNRAIKRLMNIHERIELSKKTGKLDLSKMGLECLPELPTAINSLRCRDNNLKSLPNLPETLTYLDCGHNQLTTLPSLPPTLKEIYCSTNQLTSMPTLPPGLIWLSCHSNNITWLPSLPQTLRCLACWNNQLTVLPTINFLLEYLGHENNPYSTEYRKLLESGKRVQEIREHQVSMKQHKSQLRDTLVFQQTLQRCNTRCMNDDCLNIVGSYLSGQTGTLSIQLATLKMHIASIY